MSLFCTSFCPFSMPTNYPSRTAMDEEEEEDEEEDDDDDVDYDEQDEEADNESDEDSVSRVEAIQLEKQSRADESINKENADGSSSPTCPICFEHWTSEGPHRVCCIPCGHLYGRSCLEKWLAPCRKNTRKCPQCNRKTKMTDIINLYAPIIVVRDDNLEKELTSLRKRNNILMSEKEDLIEEINKYKKKACLEQTSSRATQGKLCGHCNWGSSNEIHSLAGHSFHPQQRMQMASQNRSFMLQHELAVHGARVLGVDSSAGIMVVAGKAPGVAGDFVLNKISLLAPYGTDVIQLPRDTGPVRDLSILPGNLTLIASLGKKLSLFSMDSNQLVLSYSLQAPAWSCSSDSSSPYHVYAGLQNGTLMVFDIRQTAREVEAIAGMSSHPIHTIHSTRPCDGGREVLTGSSIGPCLWDVSGYEKRPFLVPGVENEGVCISLAYNSSEDDFVASFRQKVEHLCETVGSQSSPLATPCPVLGKLGSHILIKRVDDTTFQRCGTGYSYVSEARMSKSAIISGESSDPLFAYGDESIHRTCLSHLPSFSGYTCLKPHPCPILDLKYDYSTSFGLLGCLSEERLQLYSCYGC